MGAASFSVVLTAGKIRFLFRLRKAVQNLLTVFLISFVGNHLEAQSVTLAMADVHWQPPVQRKVSTKAVLSNPAAAIPAATKAEPLKKEEFTITDVHFEKAKTFRSPLLLVH